MLAWAFAAAAALTCNHPGITIIAHRGGMDSRYPENTLPAFHHAAAIGADAIELDLRATRDGRVVILHDPRLERTTNGHGPVSEHSADEVARLDTGNGIPIPTLDAVLADDAVRNVRLLLDVKPAPGLDLKTVVAEVRSRDRTNDVIFGVRSLKDHARLVRLDPGLRFLGFIPRARDAEAFIHAGVGIVRLWPRWVARQPELMKTIHATGGRVWVTAGDASVDELARMAALGVDGFLTDRPAQAVSALGTCRTRGGLSR